MFDDVQDLQYTGLDSHREERVQAIHYGRRYVFWLQFGEEGRPSSRLDATHDTRRAIAKVGRGKQLSGKAHCGRPPSCPDLEHEVLSPFCRRGPASGPCPPGHRVHRQACPEHRHRSSEAPASTRWRRSHRGREGGAVSSSQPAWSRNKPRGSTRRNPAPDSDLALGKCPRYVASSRTRYDSGEGPGIFRTQAVASEPPRGEAD